MTEQQQVHEGRSPGIAKRSVAADLIEGFLFKLKGPPKDYRTIPYAELNAVAHIDVQRKGRSALITALKSLARPDGAAMVFVAVHGIGIKLATDSEQAALSASALRFIANKARRQNKRSECIDLSQLSNAEKLDLSASQAVLGIVQGLSRPIVRKRLSAHLQTSGPRALGVDELIEYGGLKKAD
jgi:intracellular sulfur oxidation DsrE/DsrF family protein